MRNINAIVAVDLNWGIGYKGQLLERIPEDMRKFKSLTVDNIVVMGRKTLESLPNGIGLPNRENIVLTRNLKYVPKDRSVQVYDDIDNLIEYLRECEKNVFIIGGGEIYRLFFDYCELIYVTQIHKRYEADTIFPNLNLSSKHRIISAEDRYPDNGVQYTFLTYKRIQ